MIVGQLQDTVSILLLKIVIDGKLDVMTVL